MQGIAGGLIATARGPVEAAVAGAGAGVLLIHGTPGSWRQLVPLAEDLAAEHTVVLPSRPGYGRTPLAAGCTYDEQAATYAALLDAVAIENVAVVGVSGGGPSAAAFAARYPERTRALVLACPLAPDRFTIPVAMRIALLPLIGEALSGAARWRRRRQLADPATLERLMAKELTPAERSLFDDAMRRELERFFRSHLDAPAGLAGFRNDMAQARGARPFAAAITAPTLVQHGDADAVVPLDHARAYAEAIPGAELAVLSGAGHGFLLTRRAEAIPRLARFVALRESA
jgi:pimeloyl-ACP methyl ester carboxylesterase